MMVLAARVMAGVLAGVVAAGAPAEPQGGAAPVALLAAAEEAYDRGLSLARSEPAAARDAFREAAARYRELAGAGISNGFLYYNLANAELKAGELGRAILEYRRAAMFIPGDPKLRHNLEDARSLRVGEVAPSGGRALGRALLGWHASTTTRFRYNVFLAGYLAFFLLLASAVFRPRPVLRWAAAACALVWLGAGASVVADVLPADRARDAVVLADEVIVRKGNSEGFEPQFVEPLREGLELRVLEERGGWYYIELPNGRTGWIPARSAGLVEGGPPAAPRAVPPEGPPAA